MAGAAALQALGGKLMILGVPIQIESTRKKPGFFSFCVDIGTGQHQLDQPAGAFISSNFSIIFSTRTRTSEFSISVLNLAGLALVDPLVDPGRHLAGSGSANRNLPERNSVD